MRDCSGTHIPLQSAPARSAWQHTHTHTHTHTHLCSLLPWLGSSIGPDRPAGHHEHWGTARGGCVSWSWVNAMSDCTVKPAQSHASSCDSSFHWPLTASPGVCTSHIHYNRRTLHLFVHNTAIAGGSPHQWLHTLLDVCTPSCGWTVHSHATHYSTHH